MSWFEPEPDEFELARIAVHKHMCKYCSQIFECTKDSPCGADTCEICEIMKES